jgi:acyl-CoA reductase-like NAD-dependent aldehyde dehydrogenase
VAPAFGAGAPIVVQEAQQPQMSSDLLAVKDALVTIGVDGSVFENALGRLLDSHQRLHQVGRAGSEAAGQRAAEQTTAGFAAVFQRALEGMVSSTLAS